MLLNPPAGSGAFEQAGLYFGISENNYIKLIVMSSSTGPIIQALVERDGNAVGVVNQNLALPVDRVRLALVINPLTREVRALAAIGSGGPEVIVHNFSLVPDLWFSKDAAGIDFAVGTRSFADLFATHRNRAAGLGPLTYRFDDFKVTAVGGGSTPPPPPAGDVDFRRWAVGSSNPTSIV